MGPWNAMLVVSLSLAGLLGAALYLDIFLAASTSWRFLGAVAALCALVAGMAWAWSRRAKCLAPLLPFAALLAFLPWVDISPLKPFGRFYAAIEPGMTEAEVLRALDDQFPPTGQYPRPSVNRLVGPNHLGFILDQRDWRYDTEIVGVDFEAGRVVRKQYYYD